MACRHCGRNRVNRPRGLCWSCYYAPGVRERYPSTSKFAKRGVGNGNGMAPLPSSPTGARPGSPEKVAILEQRARQRQALWHPQDAPMDAEQSPEAPISVSPCLPVLWFDKETRRQKDKEPRSLLLGVA